MPATTGQVTPSQEAGRPAPQTTTQPAGGPFIRHAQPGRQLQFLLTSQAFSTPVNQPLRSQPGYLRALRLRVACTGSSASTSVAMAADGPFNLASLVSFYDAFGTPIIVAPGWEALYAIPKYGGQFGVGLAADPKQLYSWAAVTSASGASAGNFTFATAIPLEVVKGVGCISVANAALLPRLQILTNPAATVYATGTTPGTAGTMEYDVDGDFYWLPDQPVEPPGLGTTAQWILNVANPTIGSTANQVVTLPRPGGYLTGIILILRDSGGARIDAFGTRLTFLVDGVPLIDTRFDTLVDDMYIENQWGANVTGGVTRDTGVIVISRKTSLGRQILGLLDSGETLLSTNPGTSLALQCSPWGTISNAPATLNVLMCQIVPAGNIVLGLPEV
ncbi:MAG TPA: hypothetical protein VN771_01695 [Candidatus Baltobacteraceae bacterium]|nr:hypothetical protein [Candidatus Baltobacteraceae bacterium]